MKAPSLRLGRRTGFVLLAAAAGIAGGVFLVPLAVRALFGLLDLVLTGSIWLATSLGADADLWTVLTTVARAFAGVFMTSRALAVVAMLVLVSAFALYGLQRLLGTEEEP